MICTCIKNTPFFIEKGYKLNLNGLTKLKDGKYNNRYVTGSNYEAAPNGTVRVIAPSQDKDSKKRRKTNTVPDISDLRDPKEVGGPKKYRLNKRKIRGRIIVYTDLVRRSNFFKRKQLYFWTISFPAGTTDEMCYQLLNTWLTALRQPSRYHKPILHSYLWVAERQKNGTIHFHLLIPHYMNVKIANRAMRVAICTQIRKKKLNYDAYAAKRYNGVDIAKPRDKSGKAIGPPINFLEKKRARSLQRYLTKYITKNDTEMGRLCWNSSVDWSVPFSGVCMTREEMVRVVRYRSMLKTTRIWENDWVKFCPWSSDPPKRLSRHLADINTYIISDYFTKIGKADFFFN
jgi:hypothetical protein